MAEEAMRAGVQPHRSTLVPVWRAAGSAWVEGGPLYDADPAYDGRVDGYVYNGQYYAGAPSASAPPPMAPAPAPMASGERG